MKWGEWQGRAKGRSIGVKKRRDSILIGEEAAEMNKWGEMQEKEKYWSEEKEEFGPDMRKKLVK